MWSNGRVFLALHAHCTSGFISAQRDMSACMYSELLMRNDAVKCIRHNNYLRLK